MKADKLFGTSSWHKINESVPSNIVMPEPDVFAQDIMQSPWESKSHRSDKFLEDCEDEEIPTAATDPENATKFQELVKLWYRETGMLSVIRDKSMHMAYQKIIGMGKDALPFIFQELKQRRGHWLWALHAITGENVAKKGASLKEAVDAWMEWGERNGYI